MYYYSTITKLILLPLLFLVSPIDETMSENLIDPFEGGRIISRGTFAVSAHESTSSREKSYARSSEDFRRISTYLPKMTMIYQIDSSSRKTIEQKTYIKGITQFGIPAFILENELFPIASDNNVPKDVVVHRDHEGCRDKYCQDEMFPIEAGEVFGIIELTDDIVRMKNSVTGAIAVYKRRKFEELEQSGHLTLHKDRVSPRWKINDGYANRLSLACGQRLTSDLKLETSLDEYRSPPTNWKPDDIRWSIKAIEVFSLGKIIEDEERNLVRGVVHEDYGATKENHETYAVDLTVYSYNDNSWDPGKYKFVGIWQDVHCQAKRSRKKLRPQYVIEATLYYDSFREDDHPRQDILLPQQFTEETKKDLFQVLNRSFYYSLNNSEDFGKLFDKVSKKIGSPAAVSNIISRLNSSCSQELRSNCAKIANKIVLSETPPQRKPRTSE